jgi:enamine deaminase RidA (YjgF/YER057c/UK114 family)
MTMRQNLRSNSKWEDAVGYSRAVRVGDRVVVAGTTAAEPDGSVPAPGDMYAQAKRCLDVIEKALQDSGATMLDVVRTRIYVTDISRWEEVARAHVERFGSVRPAATMVQVAALIHPDMLVEIEAEAIVAL